MTMPALYNKTGWLTDYGMSCGFIHSMTDHTGTHIKLWKEHNVFFVRAYNRDANTNIVQSFHKVTDARAAYLTATK